MKFGKMRIISNGVYVIFMRLEFYNPQDGKDRSHMSIVAKFLSDIKLKSQISPHLSAIRPKYKGRNYFL